MHRGNHLTRSRKGRSGFTAVVGAIILLGLLAVIGSVALIWGNNFNFEKQKLSDYYSTNMNKIKEKFIIEDIWLGRSNWVNVTIANVGDIAIDIQEVTVMAVDSNDMPLTNCLSTPCVRTVKAPFTPNNSDGLIAINTNLRIDVTNIDWDHLNSKSLHIFVKTERGSIIWTVKDLTLFEICYLGDNNGNSGFDPRCN